MSGRYQCPTQFRPFGGLARRLSEIAPSALRWTKLSLNNWMRMAGPTFDASLALEFLGFAGPEARERIRATFTKDRPQQTEQGSAARVVSMDSVAWNAGQREIFLRLCWPEMVQFNYSANESYWANTPAAAVSGLTV